jgi:hypothetical protein
MASFSVVFFPAAVLNSDSPPSRSQKMLSPIKHFYRIKIKAKRNKKLN